MPSLDQLQALLQTLPNELIGLLAFLLNMLIIPLALTVFLAISRVATALIWWLIETRARVRRIQLSEQRATTLRALIRSIADVVAVIVVLIFVLSRFVTPSAAATTLGLFSAGVGFAARPFISDVLGGLVLLFEDQYGVGEKIELGDRSVIGIVERVTLRVTEIRGEAGELWIVPNGDVRTLRNFSRASFSPANIRITVPTRALQQTIQILEEIIQNPGEDLVEPPEIISADGAIGEQTELILKVKAHFGKGALVRRRLLARLQQHLIDHQIIAQSHGPESL